MFGRNWRGGSETSGDRSWHWWRRKRRRHNRQSAMGGETLGDLMHVFGDVARGQALYFADRYRNQAADVVEDFAWSLRDASERRDPDGGGSPVLDDIADDLEDFSDVIRDMRLSSALSEVEYLARRRPLLFGIGALAAGYFLTRAARRGRKGY